MKICEFCILNTQDSLHSVYFAVPNEYIKKYGAMTAVHAEWLNAVLAPALVTGNGNVYNAVKEYLGEYLCFSPMRILSDILSLDERERFCEGYAKMPQPEMQKKFDVLGKEFRPRCQLISLSL